MTANAEPTRQLVRLRGRSYVAFVFSPVVPVIEWLADIDATLARSNALSLTVASRGSTRSFGRRGA